MVVVDLVGSAGSMAGVVMVGKQGGEGEQDRKKGGGGRLRQFKAQQNLDKSLLAQKELLTSYQEAAFVPFQLSLFA